MEYSYFNPITNKKFEFIIFKSDIINLSILVLNKDKYFIGQDEIYENVFNWKTINNQTGQGLLDEQLEWRSLLEDFDQQYMKLVTNEIERLICQI